MISVYAGGMYMLSSRLIKSRSVAILLLTRWNNFLVFLNNFLKKYPRVTLRLKELLTEDVISQLEQNQIDAGLLALPLEMEGMQEYPLFNEDFVVYSGAKNQLLNKKYIPTKDIDTDQLLLLEEGHCLRTQIINLCALKAIEHLRHVHRPQSVLLRVM